MHERSNFGNSTSVLIETFFTILHLCTAFWHTFNFNNLDGLLRVFYDVARYCLNLAKSKTKPSSTYRIGDFIKTKLGTSWGRCWVGADVVTHAWGWRECDEVGVEIDVHQCDECDSARRLPRAGLQGVFVGRVGRMRGAEGTKKAPPNCW